MVNGIWEPTTDLTLQLNEETDGLGNRSGWTFTDANDTTETFDVDGTLLTITNRNGFSQILAYDLSSAQGGDDNPDTLDKVTGPFGRTLTKLGIENDTELC